MTNYQIIILIVEIIALLLVLGTFFILIKNELKNKAKIGIRAQKPMIAYHKNFSGKINNDGMIIMLAPIRLNFIKIHGEIHNGGNRPISIRGAYIRIPELKLKRHVKSFNRIRIDIEDYKKFEYSFGILDMKFPDFVNINFYIVDSRNKIKKIKFNNIKRTDVLGLKLGSGQYVSV